MHLLASAWRLAGAMLMDIKQVAEDTSTIKAALREDIQFRNDYLVLYDLVNVIVNVNQQRFALLATTARKYDRTYTFSTSWLFTRSVAHWQMYFKVNAYKKEGDDQPEFVFDWTFLKDVHKSFLDSIIVELGLPKSPFRKQILLQILREAIEETPRDAKRFPKILWDAMGDFSVRRP